MAKRKKDNEESSQENPSPSNDSADNFGLPEIDYKPLDRTEESVQEASAETSSHAETESRPETPLHHEEPREEVADYSDDEPRSSAPLIITLIIIVVLIASGFLIYKYWYVPKAKAKQEQLAREEADKKKKEEDARMAREKEEAERQRLAAEAAAKANPPAGTIETLTAPTRRFYVIVTSDIDGDLVMDYAKKLSIKGVSSKFIPPIGNTKFNRLAISDFETYREAQSSADASKADYGSAVWVMRY